MNKKRKKTEPQKEKTLELSKNNPDDYVEVEIEKNFILRTRKDHDRSRLEKWHIGRRNFS